MAERSPSSERRSFLTFLNAGATSLAALAIATVAPARAKTPVTPRWEPARHEKDDWLDKQTARHRMLFDTTTAGGFGDALAFARNFINVNRTDYGLQSSELGLVIVARHQSAPFGYSDAMWAKYGTAIAPEAAFEDPKTKAAPTANVYSSTLDALAKEGVQVAVCTLSTRRFAGAIAKAVGADANTINSELIANLASNARMVPAGIVTVNRAQERGFSLARS